MKKLLLLIIFFLFSEISFSKDIIQKWDVFEIALSGNEGGNPFINLKLAAVFNNRGTNYEVEGFYDGRGVYKVRFMPPHEGEWTYKTYSNHDDLNNKEGSFTCIKASGNNHGPVRVKNTFHFAYSDSTQFFPFGTTIYEWAFQPEERKNQTIQTLKQAPFNKVRMLLVPPHSNRYLTGPAKREVFPFEGNSKENFDFSRFNPIYFQQLEKDITHLKDLGIEVDLILFRPYDKGKWGFDQMDQETNDRFLKYVIARFSSFRNIWWSLSNENSFIKHLTDKDWDHYFQVIQQYDPYDHLRSIHNADRIYDYKKPWVTHVSLQYYNAVKVFGVSPLLRDIYKKPVIHDEINYEGTSAKRWGQLTGEELTYRFWVACIGGAYATHGESTSSEWIGPGGKLTGTSPERIAFLRNILESGPKGGLKPLDQYYLLNVAGKYGEYYLIYFGKETPKEWDFLLPDDDLVSGMKFKIDIIDTWDMKITSLPKTYSVEELNNYNFGVKQNGKIKLPGKPYMAIRIQRIDESKKSSDGIERNELNDEVQ